MRSADRNNQGICDAVYYVLQMLRNNGYYEFTVGVEDDNPRAIHMYQAMGFDKFLLRKQEEYQGDVYEYNLYLKKI